MKHWIGLALVVASLASGTALADEPSTAAASEAPAVGRAPAGTVVRIELAETLSSTANFKGNTFAIRLAEPIVADGGIIVPAGAKGQGEIISSGHAEPGGKAGKLVLAARYLEYKGARIPLYGLKLAASGNDKRDVRDQTLAVGVIAPTVGIIGATISGDEVYMPSGTGSDARLTGDLSLPVLGPAPAPKPRPATAQIVSPYDIGAPAAGKALAVFFRTPQFLSAARHPIVEGDRQIVTLKKSRYFVLEVDPGQHTFRAGKNAGYDTLTLEFSPGDIQYVEQAMGAGAFTAQPLLYPAGKDDFATAKDMKPMETDR